MLTVDGLLYTFKPSGFVHYSYNPASIIKDMNFATFWVVLLPVFMKLPTSNNLTLMHEYCRERLLNDFLISELRRLLSISINVFFYTYTTHF